MATTQEVKDVIFGAIGLLLVTLACVLQSARGSETLAPFFLLAVVALFVFSPQRVQAQRNDAL